MSDLLLPGAPWTDATELAGPDTGDACPGCGAGLDPSDLDLDLLGAHPLSCRRCGAVLGH
jgi:hypothetical protein